MNAKKNFAFHLNYNDDYREIPYNKAMNNLINVYILCKKSFPEDPYFDVSNLFQKDNLNIPNGMIKTDFTIDEIISFKKNKIDFYIVDKEKLQSIFQSRGIYTNFTSNISFCDNNAYKILYFYNEYRTIAFTIKANKNFNINYKSINNKLSDANTKIKDDLNYYKRECEKLREENYKLKNENIKLNKELIKANKIISNLNDTIGANTKFNEINYLKNIIINKDNEINDLKLKLQNNFINKKSVNFDDIVYVHFISLDNYINYGIKCLKTDTFAEVEEKLYQKYDEYRNTNNNFVTKGKVVLRFKKICENGIQDGDKVQLLNIE